MDLLEVPLPELRLRIDREPAEFFDDCEDLARSRGWGIDRRKESAGPGYDQLNLYLGGSPRADPMVRMASRPGDPKLLHVGVVDDWKDWTAEYDEYVAAARSAYAELLDEYKTVHGRRYRLGVPRKPVELDYDALDCAKISYAAEKLGGLRRNLAIGAGDARDRLIHAHRSFHVIRPNDLPKPLAGHLGWVYSQITKKPARHRLEGSVEATVRSMRRATAGRILERLLDIADAVERLDRHCRKIEGN